MKAKGKLVSLLLFNAMLASLCAPLAAAAAPTQASSDCLCNSPAGSDCPVCSAPNPDLAPANQTVLSQQNLPQPRDGEEQTDVLRIGNTFVTEENSDDVLGDGSVSYNQATYTLTLTNCKSPSTDIAFQPVADTPLTIQLVGNNSVKSISVYNYGNLIIEGPGSLEIENSNTCIQSDQKHFHP